MKESGKVFCSGKNAFRKWATRVFTNKNGFVVIVATHPSRAKWDSEAADPTPFIKKILQERSII